MQLIFALTLHFLSALRDLGETPVTLVPVETLDSLVQRYTPSLPGWTAAGKGVDSAVLSSRVRPPGVCLPALDVG